MSPSKHFSEKQEIQDCVCCIVEPQQENLPYCRKRSFGRSKPPRRRLQCGSMRTTHVSVTLSKSRPSLSHPDWSPSLVRPWRSRRGQESDDGRQWFGKDVCRIKAEQGTVSFKGLVPKIIQTGFKWGVCICGARVIKLTWSNLINIQWGPSSDSYAW